jgi:hypothetical protein
MGLFDEVVRRAKSKPGTSQKLAPGSDGAAAGAAELTRRAFRTRIAVPPQWSPRAHQGFGLVEPHVIPA